MSPASATGSGAASIAGSGRPPIPLRRALALGVVQGPTELLPVSSSAHLALVPWLADWGWEELDPSVRKSFDVAVHAGGAAALVCGQRRAILEELRGLDRRQAMVLGLSFVPPALVGYLLERPIEDRLGGPLATAGGLVAGAIGMTLADLRPQRRGRGEVRALDGLALGLGQAVALIPGVSRNGATLTAARFRLFSRDQANFLSRSVALPVIAAATLLKGVRLRRRRREPALRRALVAGTAASFVSTLASQRLIRLVERDRALWPYAAYRTALAALVLVRLRRERRAERADCAVHS